MFLWLVIKIAIFFYYKELSDAKLVDIDCINQTSVIEVFLPPNTRVEPVCEKRVT